MKTKTFDCVEMKRSAAERIYEQTRTMTPAEELAFWKEEDVELRKLCGQVIAESNLPRTA